MPSDFELIAEEIAQEIKAAVFDVAAPNAAYEARHHANLCGKPEEAKLFARDVAKRIGGRRVSFSPIPVPDASGGIIADHDGVIVRVMRDYDFRLDRSTIRADVCFTVR